MKEEMKIDEYYLENYQKQIKRNPYGFGFPDDHPDLVNQSFDEGVDLLKKIFKVVPYAILSFSLFFNPIYAGNIDAYKPRKEAIVVEKSIEGRLINPMYTNLNAIIEKTPMEDFKEKHKRLESRL
ncbi:MAG: hypothetical protein PHT94_04625 [Candidatus Nanoarchaeia archaeon]|nr:hypothetical protein [Candidatus Nanoarchaeia archaeon]